MEQKEKFLQYLQTCVKSTRATESNPLLLGGNAPKDYTRFLESGKLFDYNLQKWGNINMYEIFDPEQAESIFRELISDDDFNKRDKTDNQGWRRGAISHYVCFLRAEHFFTGNNLEERTDSERADRKTNKHLLCSPLQQIFYGAPGTGKSNTVKQVTDGQPKENVFRTTFHPDSDYSTFVGCYKPSMGKAKVYGPQGVVQVGGTDVEKDEITYKFVPQAFVNAYVRAYHTEDPVFLVIEEINRGNCAQIFGDMFQLLDRNVETGESDYAIKPDTDLQNYLCGVMGDALTDCDEIKSGEEMRLPSNLYIWATMNTSDQSLFPIDSAFKRRWDWKYIPIADAGKGYQIEVGGKAYDWWDFLEKINAEIGEVTSSEDKMLGYFFAKAKGGKVTADMFVSKVLFYLWNDVFKDFGTDRPLFEKGKNDKDNTVYLSFKDFFKPNGDVNEENVIRLLDNLKVKASQEAEEDDDGNTPSTDASKRNYDKFSVNGEGAYGKNRLAEACVKKYIELHSEKSADEVVTEWKTLGEIVSHFIETEEKFNARTDNAKDRSTRVECNGSALYVAHKGYGADNGKAEVLMNAVNSKGWGITIKKL